jgi:Secretion system C-terminal sorting domain
MTALNMASGQTNFHKYNNGIKPVLEKSTDLNDWDFTVAADAEVVFYRDTFRLWYTSSGIPPQYAFPRIGYAWSLDGANWTKSGKPVFEGSPGEWDSLAVETVSILIDTLAPSSERFKMWYVGTDDPNQLLYTKMGYAFSSDGINWTKHPAPVLKAETTSTGIDVFGFEGPSVVFDGSTYHMWYTCIPYYNNQKYWDGWINIAYATSADGINWTKKKDEPVFKISRSGWDSLFVQTPDVIKIDNIYHMFYTGTSSDSTYQTAGGGWHYRVGYAWAPENDIHNWTRYATPVLVNGSSGNWDDASVGLVSIVYAKDKLHMWYTGQDSCINDTNCVWPNVPFWDTGYAIDTMTALSVDNGFLFQLKSNVLVYPNPFSEQAILQFEPNIKEHYSLKIFDRQGRIVRTITDIYDNEILISRGNLDNGVYFVQLYNNHQVVAVRKIIIQ